MKIERIKLAELRHDDQNARTHDQTNLKAIAGSLEQFGQRKPIVITSDNVVVAGNGTLTAAKLIGWTEIDCVRVPADWSADQIKAYALADNRTAELAQWDEQIMASQLLELQVAGFDIEAIGFELVNQEPESESETEDELPEQVEPRTKLGQIWQLGRHRLMCGDTTDQSTVSRLLDGSAIDMVFTDPPYGIDVVISSKAKGTVGGSNLAEANLYSPIIGDSTTETAKKFFQLCNSLGLNNYVIWGGNYFTDFLPPKKCWIVWDKKGRQWDDNFSDFEMAWTSFDKPAKIMTHVWMGMIQGGTREKRVHPTQKPAELVEACFIYLNKDAKTIFDGFGGSGSTLIAAEKTNRTCYMMELDPKYCDVIIQRWENLTGKKAELVNASR